MGSLATGALSTRIYSARDILRPDLASDFSTAGCTVGRAHAPLSASEFVRYIPGNVWHVLTRILWVSKYGVSRTTAFASMTVEIDYETVGGCYACTQSAILA